jgi:hypothetical protein
VVLHKSKAASGSCCDEVVLPAEPTLLRIFIGSGFTNARIRELQHQIHDYIGLIRDPLCPGEMRDLLVVEVSQIMAALLISCEQIDCVLY